MYAQQKYQALRWRGSRLERDEPLRNQVLLRLGQGWSPEQIAGRFKLEHQRTIISHESIYRFIYAQLARTKDYKWRHYLPRAKWRRGYRGRKGGSPASFIHKRRSIDERPHSVLSRTSPGHWEADLMLFRTYGHAVLALHERYSRILIAVRPEGKASAPIANAMSQILGQFPPRWRRSVTFDNGTEFALHHQLHELGVDTFFCDVRSPWQKGGVENAIGRLRRTLPRKTDLASVSDERFVQLIQAYNNTPRKCLNFKTPAEVFLHQALHLQCESTFPRPREKAPLIPSPSAVVYLLFPFPLDGGRLGWGCWGWGTMQRLKSTSAGTKSLPPHAVILRSEAT